MKKSSICCVGLAVLAVFLMQARAVSADSTARLEQGAQRCYQDYKNHAEQDLLSGLEVGESALQSYRCLKRYEAKVALRSVASQRLKQQISELKKKIQRLQKKARELAWKNPAAAAKLTLRVMELKAKLTALQTKLQQGECPAQKTNVKIIFENNSVYDVRIFIMFHNMTPLETGTLPSTKIGTITMTAAELRYYSGNAQSVKFLLVAKVSGSDVLVYRTVGLSRLPKEKPCKATARFELFDRTFPEPPTKYGVYGVTNAGPNLFIGSAAYLSTRTPCSFLNGGNDCTSKVTFVSLDNLYSSLDDAGRAFCNGIQGHVFWGMYAPCRERYLFNGGWYWGCESTVRTAISKFCPKWD